MQVLLVGLDLETYRRPCPAGEMMGVCDYNEYRYIPTSVEADSAFRVPFGVPCRVVCG